jgi:hypothetical protein
VDLAALTAFIVKAKRATYVGDGQSAPAARPGAHDLIFEDGAFAYRDSYFGGTDFLGQEVVWQNDVPVWAMNYYGYIVRPDLIDGQRAGVTIKAALSALYAKGRFLGGFDWNGPHGRYVDSSEGDAAHFHGREHILVGGIEAYALDYHGGLIKP